MSLKKIEVADGFESALVPGVAGVVANRTERFTLDATMVMDKAVTVSQNISTPANVVVIYNGLTQFPMIDYEIIMDTISFMGFAIDGLLEIGDQVTVIY